MSYLCGNDNTAFYVRHAATMFMNLMMVNYLAHGINIQRNMDTATPPADGLSLLVGDRLSAQDSNMLHVATHTSVGVIGLIQTAIQLRALCTTPSSPNRRSAPRPFPSSAVA